MSDAPPSSDLHALVARARRAARARGPVRPAADAARLDAYRSRLAGAPEVVLAADTAVELGPPRRRSAHAVAWTATPGLVADGRLVVVGPDLGEPGAAERAYVQLVLLEVAPGASPDVARLEAQQFFTRRLPGLMARMLPGRLWLRASRAALAAGLDFSLVAAALGRACRAVAPEVCAVECVFASGADDDVADLAALAAEVRAGRHHRLALGADGAWECVDLDCDACDDRPVCDRIRAATAIRRRVRPPLPAAPKAESGAA